ncbi:MAG: hypothetical protein LBL38_03025 [Lactobacillales bacterium]|jgi:hypothetical protein|nr:hypothetical protein [Lactobacillales bacterium]
MNSLQQMPRPIELIKEHLEDLAALEAIGNFDIPNDPATCAAYKSLKFQEEEVKEELKAAEWLESQSDVEFALEGPSVVNHSISANILSKFLDKVQKLRLAAAESAGGAASGRGRFSKSLIQDNQLMVKCFNPSSFAVHFIYFKSNTANISFEHNNDRLGEDIFLSLLSGDTNSEEDCVPSMSPRLYSHYQDFLTLLTENNVTISTRTKNHPYPIKMTPENARDKKLVINYNLTEPKEETIEIEGNLVMGDLKNNSFCIDADSTLYRGHVSADGVEGLKSFALGSIVKANLLVTTSIDESSKPNYLLLTLNKAV